MHGRAFKRIEKGNYVGGAAILEELCKNEQNNPEYSYFRLGDCYCRMGKYERAIRWLKKSFDIYSSKIGSNRDDTYRRCYEDAKEMYIYALEAVGRVEQAKIVQKKRVRSS